MPPITKQNDQIEGAGLLQAAHQSTVPYPQDEKISIEAKLAQRKAHRLALSHALDRRAQRISEISAELHHNKFHRRRFTSGTIIGWYTHPELWASWKNRKFRAYHRIHKGPNPRYPRLSSATKANYQKIVQGRISTDSILTEFEQGLLQSLVAKHEANAKRDSEPRVTGEHGRTGETELQAILRALNPNAAAVSTVTAKPDVHVTRPPLMPADDNAAESLEDLAKDPFDLYSSLMKFSEERRIAERHDRRLERAIMRDLGSDESFWQPPGEEFCLLGEDEGRAGGVLR